MSRFEAWIETPAAIYIIMEHCDGGDLLQEVMCRSRIPELEAAAWVRQISQALTFAHSNGYIHRVSTAPLISCLCLHIGRI